jgi:hypothetical protein
MRVDQSNVDNFYQLKRIHNKDHLLSHGVVTSSSLLCLGACGREETIKHLFLDCGSGYVIQLKIILSNIISLFGKFNNTLASFIYKKKKHKS